MNAYQAYTECEDNDPLMLRIEHGDHENTITSTALRCLVELCLRDEVLFICFHHATVTLKGTGLVTLFALLEQKKIRSLHCFDGKRHAPPAADEPVITKVEYHYC